MEFYNLTIKQIHQGLKEKNFSALEITEFFLNQIKEKDKEILAFITINEESALRQAEEVDKKIAKGEKISLLTGVPFAVKDNILVKNLKTTCASKILENYIAPYDATCIKRLKNLGSIILGKTNLDEFAMGSSTENSAFFPTKNPYDLKRVPGGSSGGSAAAVASQMSVFALGSDTGGSIRQPASFCGVVGLKPTYGRVSRYGLVAFASSLDQIGPLTKTPEDAKIVLKAIEGKDSFDSTTINLDKIRKRNNNIDISKLKIGFPKEYFTEGIERGIKEVIDKTIKSLEKKGFQIQEISLPHTKYALATYYLVATSEASSNLARYDGIKYGYSSLTGETLSDIYFRSRGEGFGKEVKRRIMLGTYALSAGYYDAYYLKAEKMRTLIKRDFEEAFKKVDIIFTPTTPTTAFKIGEKVKNPLSMYLADIFTVPISLTGLPAVSIPIGKSNNLPVGLQIIGNYFKDEFILDIGKLIIEDK